MNQQCESESCSVMSDSLRYHGLYSRWDSPGQNTGMGSISLYRRSSQPRDGAAGEDMRVPWTARRSNQSMLKETNPEYSLERLMLKLMLQYFGHVMGGADSLAKTLMLGKTECKGEVCGRG